MKYIKKFEKKYLPKVGDYVTCDINIQNFEELAMFLNENVGEIYKTFNPTGCMIKYKNVPNNINVYMKSYTPDELSKNNEWLYLMNNYYVKLATHKEIEQQEIKNSSNKYNL